MNTNIRIEKALAGVKNKENIFSESKLLFKVGMVKYPEVVEVESHPRASFFVHKFLGGDHFVRSSTDFITQ